MLRRLEVSELLLGRALKSQRTRIPVEEFYEWLETDQVGKSGKQAAVCVAVGRRAAGALARSIGVVVRPPTLIRKSPRPGLGFESRGAFRPARLARLGTAIYPRRHGAVRGAKLAVARTRGRQSCW